MSVSYEELEGSPKITMDRKGGSATRIFKIAWVDIDAFFAEVFPNPFNGYPVVSWVPGHSWLLADSAEAEPFDPTKPGGVNVGSDLTYSDTAKVTVKYAPPQQDQQQQATSAGDQTGGGGDGTGPGGKQGATGGEKGKASQPVTLVTHDIHVGAEFLTISNLILKWQNGDPVGPQARAGRIIPTIEHQSTWHNIVQPPWTTIRMIAGGVNNGVFLGAKTECLLFLGAEGNRDITNQGEKTWTLKYKYSEKDLKPNTGKGWNHFYRAEKGKPLTIDKLQTTDGSPIYQPVNFAGLYNDDINPFL